jgi:excinuclease ABC subunit B
LNEPMGREEILARITDLELDMWQASESMDFEKAASLRDDIRQLEAKLAGKTVKTTAIPGAKPKQKGARGRGKR